MSPEKDQKKLINAFYKVIQKYPDSRLYILGDGILKQEYDIDKFNVDLNTRNILVKQTVKVYNESRPHLSNHYLTPIQMHQQQKLIPKSYKKKNSTNTNICTV